LANAQEYNFDHPNAFDADEIVNCLLKLKTGEPVEVPEYCFKTHQRLAITRLINPSDVIIFEGILLFQFEKIVQLLNMKIFVDTDDDVRLARRIQVRLRFGLKLFP
jgi:uridine kinase